MLRISRKWIAVTAENVGPKLLLNPLVVQVICTLPAMFQRKLHPRIAELKAGSNAKLGPVAVALD
jgi:hypothetical protein